MDDVYDNLDNYADESTIAELREENGNLKSRLQEYADKLDKLQREFDMLTSEHKKLELNYSSLLKTARSEIERKTQIITKLNVEKDAMVLNSIQNRTFNNRRRIPQEKPVKDQETKHNINSNHTRLSSDNLRPSNHNHGTRERREDNSNPSSNISTPRIDQTRDVVNSADSNPNLKSSRPNVAKENIKLKDESEAARAPIRSRRKSMPVFSMEKFSSDEDEHISTGSSKECVTKEQPETRQIDPWGPSVDKRYIEDKMSHKPFTENRSRQYDSEKYRSRDRHEPFSKHRRHYSPDRNRKKSRDRRKGSPDRRRGSPNRYMRENHDNNDEFYKKQEYDRRRRLVSPSKDKYNDYKYRNRDSPRSAERNHDRYKPRDQDMHAMKHKLLPDYEQNSKRMRLDSFPKHEEDSLRIERHAGHIPLEWDTMTCQSPDQTYFDVQSHQTREIKLNASAKLDDPRLSSQKYTLKTHDGKTELSTVESDNIDVKVIDTSNWEMMKTMKMPDALLKKPVTFDLPSGLLQKPLTSAMLDTSLRKSKSSMPEALLQNQNSIPTETQKPSSSSNTFMQNSLASDTPETSTFVNNYNLSDSSVQKSCFHDKQSAMSSTKRLMSTDLPDDLIQQKPKEKFPSRRKSVHTNDLVTEIYMDIENPISNASMEPGEIYDFQNDFHGAEETNKINTQKNSKLIVPEPQKTEISQQKPSNDKKSKIIHEDSHNTKICKEILTFEIQNDAHKSDTKSKTKYNIYDSKKPSDEDVDMKHSKIKKNKSLKNRHTNIPCDYQDLVTTKEMIEGDLELSDENSDNNEVQINQTPISYNKQSSTTTHLKLNTNKTSDSKPINQKFDIDDPSIQYIKEQTLEVNHIEPTATDTRKPKARKKSLKLKETKEPHLSQDIAVRIDKPANKKENTINDKFESKDISLSMEQLVKIKENITKELSEELPSPVAKEAKKKDSKSKLPSKSKDAAITTDKPIEKKNALSKDLSENKDTAPTDKQVKRKENKSKQQHNTETAVIDKSTKKKEKTKEPHEPKSSPSEKPFKRRQNKMTESSKATECVIIEKPDNKSKFNELFGDSSSLVSPEDLGLVPTVPPESYVALFEDALDATDVSATILPTEKTKDKDSASSHFGLHTKNIATPAINVAVKTKKPMHVVTKQAESTVNQTIYQNLLPQISPKDDEVVKTVIISSGTQPQRVLEATTKYPFENDKTNADLHVMQCVKPTVVHGALQALATSTPQKIWQQNVIQTEIGPKLTAIGCSNESQEASNKSPATVDSDTNTSLTKTTDEPDMTIFVKRRRKVVKKK